MKINLPPGTTCIEILVSGSTEEPSINLVPQHRSSATIADLPDASVWAGVSPCAPTGPRKLVLVASTGAALLVGGFMLGALRTAPPAQAALSQPMTLEMPISRSMARVAPYAPPPLERPDPEQQPQLAPRQPGAADDVLRQLATRPTVTPPPRADVDAAPPKNPFGLE